MITPTKTKRTCRRVTVENSHDLHRNPYTDVNQTMEWANVHRILCEKCRNRKTRKPRRGRWSEYAGGPENDYAQQDGDE